MSRSHHKKTKLLIYRKYTKKIDMQNQYKKSEELIH